VPHEPVPDSEILRHVGANRKALRASKALVRELGVRGADRRDLAEKPPTPRDLRCLTQVDSDRFAIPKTATNHSSASSMHRDGYGFVIPNRSNLKEPLRSQLSGEYLSPAPDRLVDARRPGLVEVTSVRADGRAEGRILRTVDRAHATVVGTFHYGRRHNYVTPMDEKITQEIIIAQGNEYPPEATTKRKSPL